MTDPSDDPRDPILDGALERLLARKAERAAASTLPLEALLDRSRSEGSAARRRLALLATVAVLGFRSSRMLRLVGPTNACPTTGLRSFLGPSPPQETRKPRSRQEMTKRPAVTCGVF